MLREEFDDWAILFNPDTGRGFGLNPTGVYLWKLLDGEHSMDETLTAMRRDAKDVPQEAGAHIVAFVEELTQHGMVTHEPAVAHKNIQLNIQPHQHVSDGVDVTRFAYEPPKLINLSGEHAAGVLNCSNGSQADCCPNVGNLASGQHGSCTSFGQSPATTYDCSGHCNIGCNGYTIESGSCSGGGWATSCSSGCTVG